MTDSKTRSGADSSSSGSSNSTTDDIANPKATGLRSHSHTGLRSQWSGKWAFILAAAASAVGLGNLWRFPYLAAKYGGGIFLLTYLVIVFTVGISLLLLEISLGRKSGQSAIGAFKHFGKKYAFIGVFISTIPFIITSYYCIIGGWVTKYAVSYLTNNPQVMADGGGFFTAFISSNAESYLWMLLFMAVTFGVVALGVKSGIEKANLIMMPTLIVMALALAIYTLTIPGALEGAMYYLLPDFSKFSPELVIGALGQVFYSLSLAMGIMITYGSYISKRDKLPSSVARIGGFDLGVSFLAGLVIVPAAFAAMGSGAAVAENAGPSLMFVVMPSVFGNMGGAASIVGFVFFLLVVFAALTSSISLAETCVSIVKDATGWSRRRSFISVVVVLVAAGIFINAGYNGLSFIQPLGEGSTLLDFFDFISNSVMMPIAAILTCIFVGWVVKTHTLSNEIEQSGRFALRRPWEILVKYVAPVLVILIMVSFIAQQFGLFRV